MVPAIQPSSSAARGARVVPEYSDGTSQTHPSTAQPGLGKASAPSTPEAARTRTEAVIQPRLVPGSRSMGEPLGQLPRQSRREDLAGGRDVVVRQAADRYRARVPVPDRVAGSRVTVTRLANAPHVDQVPTAVIEPNLRRGRVEAADVIRAPAAHRPEAGHVRVPDEAEACREVAEHAEAILLGDQVVPLLGAAGTRVHERGVLVRADQGQAAEVVPMSLVELPARPQRGRARPRVEPTQVQPPERAVLVVARDHRGRPLT